MSRWVWRRTAGSLARIEQLPWRRGSSALRRTLVPSRTGGFGFSFPTALVSFVTPRGRALGFSLAHSLVAVVTGRTLASLAAPLAETRRAGLLSKIATASLLVGTGLRRLPCPPPFGAVGPFPKLRVGPTPPTFSSSNSQKMRPQKQSWIVLLFRVLPRRISASRYPIWRR